jgi:butyrate kinase
MMKKRNTSLEELDQLRQELTMLEHRQVELEALLATKEQQLQQLKALQDKETLLQVVTLSSKAVTESGLKLLVSSTPIKRSAEQITNYFPMPTLKISNSI